MGVGADVGGVRSPHDSTVALLKKLTNSTAVQTSERP